MKERALKGQSVQVPELRGLPVSEVPPHTYREWDTLDAADGEAVVAGIAGAAEHLVAVHGADYCPFDATAEFVLVLICDLLDITTVFSNLLNGQLRHTTHSQRYRSDWTRTTSTQSGCHQRHLLASANL